MMKNRIKLGTGPKPKPNPTPNTNPAPNPNPKPKPKIHETPPPKKTRLGLLPDLVQMHFSFSATMYIIIQYKKF